MIPVFHDLGKAFMSKMPGRDRRMEIEHYTNAEGYLVFTERHLLNRGSCCGCGCLHCPFEPRADKGNTKVQEAFEAYLAQI
jgi:hypothetical protein